MNNLFDKDDVEQILVRLENLSVDSKRKWGSMNVSQMLAHCNVSVEMALGMNFPKRKLIGRLFGKMIKKKFINKKPMMKNSPTENTFVTLDNAFDFDREKARTIILIQTFYEEGREKCTQHPHSYFGVLKPEEWAILKWKHFDHHFRQFDV